MMRFLHTFLALLFVSNVALADRKQNDNIDMNGNAIKNADVQGGTASNTSRITVPKNTKTNLDSLTRKEGTIVYGTDTAKLYVDNGSLLSPVGSGEGGTGVNAVANPSAATDLTGYSDSDGDAAGNHYIRTTTSSELPIYPSVTTGVKIDADASSEYIAYCGQMPEALKNRKLRFSQFQKVESGYDSGDMRLEIYPSTSSTCASVGTEYALNKDSSGVTSIPSATQDFWVTFDADSSDYFQIRWVRTNASTEYIVVQNVYIGAGDQPTGPPKHGPISYTPTWTGSGSNPAIGNGTLTAKYYRDNTDLVVSIDILMGSTTTFGSGLWSFSLPSGLTIDTSARQFVQYATQVGQATAFDSSGGGGVYYYSGDVKYDTTTTVVISNTAASAYAATVPFTWATSDVLSVTFRVPISQWGDSSNVVNFGSQDREYLSNSSSSTSSDTSSFAYNQDGAPFYGYTSQITKRVQAQSPIQKGDLIFLEVSRDSGATWSIIGSQNGPVDFAVLTQRQGTVLYGMNWVRVSGSTTQIDVQFEAYRSPSGVSTYASSGAPWSDIAGGTHRWRILIIRGNALGGFQYATSTASGLVRNGGPSTILSSSDMTSQTNVTIDSGDVANTRWKRVDNMVTLFVQLNAITISGGASTFSFTLPSTVPTPSINTSNACIIYDNSGSVPSSAECGISTSRGFSVSKVGGTFTGGGNSSYFRGQITYPTD